MPDNNNTGGTNLDEILNQGEEANPEDGETEEGETGDENAAEGVSQNNPEDNKKLSEITMAEQIRKTYNLTVKFPRILEGLHTNQFFFLDVTDDFYEKNYPEIISTIADKKFARFAGFKKGRFFVEKVEEKGGMDGWSTTLTLNPIPPSLAVYSKMQKEAQKALIQAINDEIALSGGGSGGGLTQTHGSDCGEDISTWAPKEWGPEGFEKGASTIIGNSSANYATETANMSAEQAIKSINHTYSSYYDNATCPAQLWESYPNIHANCADFARLVKCICDVHGQKCTIHHGSAHYWNYVYINGNWESVDLCTVNNNTWDGHPRNSAGWQ